MDKRGWILGMAAALALALLSLLTSITSEAQLTGEADTLLTTRLSVNKLLNTGTAWAGLPILAGWMVRRPLGAAAIGVVSCPTALVTHYGLGQVVGIFEPEIWASNRYWFAFALVLGAPLGLVGSLAHRAGVLGLLARLTAPLGATLEPFVLQMFAQPDGQVAELPLLAHATTVLRGIEGAASPLTAQRQTATIASYGPALIGGESGGSIASADSGTTLRIVIDTSSPSSTLTSHAHSSM
ncbi:MAG: hypothetical protein KDB41_02500 [Propionibacteriaceae bacterium]|nr:hypothetical protein [Propionibacteriaceae bacterium]